MKSVSPLHDHMSDVAKLTGTTRVEVLTVLNLFVTHAKRERTRAAAASFQSLLASSMPAPYVRQAMGILRLAAELSAEAEGVPPDWANIRKPLGKGKTDQEPLSEGQFKELLDTCRGGTPQDLRDFALMVFAAETGLRKRVLATIRWDDIPKSPHPHSPSVPVSDTALAALKPWRDWCKKHTTLDAPIVIRLDQATPGGGMSHAALYPIIQKRASLTNVGPVPVSALRASFIASRLCAGVPPALITIVTGQKLPGVVWGSLGGLTPLDAERIRAATPEWLKQYVLGEPHGR